MRTLSSTNVVIILRGPQTGRKEAGMPKTVSEETERLKRHWEREAPTYDRRMGFFERVLFGDGREWVCSRASGEVLEVAVGTGRNFTFYPQGVRLSGIDLSPAMLEIARKRAEELGVDADLREGDAQQLPFADASFDTVVCTLSLCNIPDDRRAIAEMKRVLRPGGRLLLLDHVRASSKVWLAVQRVLEPLPRRFSCEHLLRRPLEHVLAEGFEVEQRERSKAGIVERLSARKPG
jgi:ubiquinone/menaquinone biosynthesis C-methylase UbiE